MEVIIGTRKLEPEKSVQKTIRLFPVLPQNMTNPEASSLFLASSVYDKSTFSRGSVPIAYLLRSSPA